MSESGVPAFVPEKWAVLPISVMNGRSEPRDILCATYFEQDSSLQYGRRVWVPARSLLRIGHPVLIPRLDANEGRNLESHSFVFDESSPNEALIKSDGGQVRHDGALLVSRNRRNTGIISKPSDAEDGPLNEVAELVVASRLQLDLSKSFTLLGEAFLPADETGLDALDHIVVADNRLLDDWAATTTLRRWLYAGGHLWVMLDRVDPGILASLIGNDFEGYVVDRVGLTSVRVDEAPGVSDLQGKSGETNIYDDPVEFVRMSVEGFNVTHVVNGWPAAMTVPCGDGMLFITTLGPRGWMKSRTKNAREAADLVGTSNFTPTSAMSNIAGGFFGLREPELLRAGAIESQVREYIGYNVLSWRLVVGTLIGFSSCFVVIGMWLLRIGRLEQICWAGLVPSLMASLFLIHAGRTNRSVIPATKASVQLVQASRGTSDLRSIGLASVYHPEGSETPIAVTEGGRLQPDMSGLEQSTRRMVTTDLGVYQWENLRQPAGVRSTSFEHWESAADPLQAHVTFDAEGVSGTYVGAIPLGADAILASRNGRLGVTPQGGGTFVARGDQVFEKDQYLSAGLLSDEQDRRRRFLKEILDNPSRPDYPRLPQLMFWSGPRDNGFRFGEALTNQGAALIAVPLVIQRPPNGTEIMIPSPFIDYFNRRSPDGTQPSALWNAEKKQWQERASPSLAWLSFQIPHGLCPVTARGARVDLKVSGPIGRVEILGLKNGNVIGLSSHINPVGSFSVEIADADALGVDHEGRMALGVKAGYPVDADTPQSLPNVAQGESAPSVGRPIGQARKADYWRIESLSLQLRAETIESTHISEAQIKD